MVRTRGGMRRSPPPPTEENDSEAPDIVEPVGENVVNEEEDAIESGGEAAEEEAAEEEATEQNATEEQTSPVEFHFKHSKWLDICKIATRCDLRKTVDIIERRLEEWELEWFTNHAQFRHYFHMPRADNRRVMGMWMLLLRTVNTSLTKQCWFVVNGVPVCYSIAEHALISGLNCREYPVGYNQFGSFDFVQRCFGREDKIDIVDIKNRLDSMENASGDDRIKLALLYFLTTVIKGKSKVKGGYIEPFLLRIVDDLDVCRTFPWGTFSFSHVMEEVEHLIEHFEGEVQGSWTFPGFILPLEVLPYECIPSLDQKFRKDVVGADKACPRLCKRMFKRLNHKGIPLGDVYGALGTTKVCKMFGSKTLTALLTFIFLQNIKCLEATVDEHPLLEETLDGQPDEVTEPLPESWSETLLSASDGGLYWQDLFDKDVATRAEGIEEHEPAEVADDAEVPAVTVDQRVEAFEEDMKQKFILFKDDLRKSYLSEFMEMKVKLKKLVAGLVEAEFRKRAGSSYDKGESSKGKQIVEDLEEAENSEEAEESEKDEEAEGVEADYDEEETLSSVKKSVMRLRKRRKQN